MDHLLTHVKLPRIPIRYFDEHATGEILNRATNDIQTIDDSFSQVSNQILTSAFTFVGIIIMLFTIHWGVTLLGILGVPLSIFVISKIGQKSQQAYTQRQEKLGHLNGCIEEHYGGHEVVKAFSYEKRSMIAFDAMNDDLYASSWKAQFFSGLMVPISRLINNIVYVFIAVIGRFLVSIGRLSIGNIQAILQYTQNLSQPMGDAANMIGLVQSMLAAAKRVFELLDAPEMANETHKPNLQSC